MKIYQILLKHFGPQGWWPIMPKADRRKQRSQPDSSDELDSNARFEIIVGAILTQNTSWKNVEKAIQNLRKKGLISRKAILAVREAELAEDIRPSGYYKQKAKKLKAFVSFDFKGEITRDNLLSIWGVGPETADSILLYAYEKPYFVIDAYTKRIFTRLGCSEAETTYDELQNLFHENIPKDVGIYKEFHALIVRLGKEFCKKNPVCTGCPLAKICKSGSDNMN